MQHSLPDGQCARLELWPTSVRTGSKAFAIWLEVRFITAGCNEGFLLLSFAFYQKPTFGFFVQNKWSPVFNTESQCEEEKPAEAEEKEEGKKKERLVPEYHA